MTTITQDVTLWEPAPSWFTRAATLIYDTADPYAITIRFDSGPEWSFARDLLIDAVELGHTTGLDGGDVLIEPEPDLSWDTKWLTLTRYPGRSYAVELLLDQEEASAFLNDTNQAVPSGTEAYQINWPAELATLTGGAA